MARNLLRERAFYIYRLLAVTSVEHRCIRSDVDLKDVTTQHRGRAKEGPAARQTPLPSTLGQPHQEDPRKSGSVAGGTCGCRPDRAQLHERNRTWRSQLLHAAPAEDRAG